MKSSSHPLIYQGGAGGFKCYTPKTTRPEKHTIINNKHRIYNYNYYTSFPGCENLDTHSNGMLSSYLKLTHLTYPAMLFFNIKNLIKITIKIIQNKNVINLKIAYAENMMNQATSPF